MEPKIESFRYWVVVRDCEASCEKETLSAGLFRSEIAMRLGTVTSLLYRLACCHWGCHGKEHIFEFLAGRTCTSANSAVRLLGFGYYDESLAITRSIAEIGNLTHLFLSEPSHIRSWLDASDQERKRRYSPAAVRKSLEELGSEVPTDQSRYSWLCEIGTHVTPLTQPQVHNDEGQPILGTRYQAQGCETALNELAFSVCTVAGPLANIAILESSQADRLVKEAIALFKLVSPRMVDYGE